MDLAAPAWAPPLDPELQAAMAGVAADSPPLAERLRMSAPQARHLQRRIAAQHFDPGPEVAEVREVRFRGGEHPLAARIYAETPVLMGRPVCLFLHGGGGVVGDLDTHDGLARRLTMASGLIVVSLDYSRGPERPFPAALRDVELACRALREGQEVGAPPPALAIAGDSIGAALALEHCRRRGPRSEIAGLSLFYGMYDADPHSWSQRAYAAGPGLSGDLLGWFADRYAGQDSHLRAGAFPANQAFDYAPPTQLIEAELDPLRAGGVVLAKKLAHIGALADQITWPGAPHGFAQLPGTAAGAAVQRAGAFLREVCARPAEAPFRQRRRADFGMDRRPRGSRL